MLDRVKDQGVTIAIQNGGGLRASIDAGEVTMGDVLTVLPFQNTLSTFNLTGADVVAALENGLSQVEEGAGRFPQVAGLTYRLGPGGRAVRRVSDGDGAGRATAGRRSIRRRPTPSSPTTTCAAAATATPSARRGDQRLRLRSGARGRAGRLPRRPARLHALHRWPHRAHRVKQGGPGDRALRTRPTSALATAPGPLHIARAQARTREAPRSRACPGFPQIRQSTFNLALQ